MSGPSAKEVELISQFRKRLADVMPTLRDEQKTDLFFVRWIRAREGNLDLAEGMLRDSLRWREENDIDNILSWEPPEEFLKICPAEFLGYDKFNSPVTYFPFGKWNLKKVAQIGQKDTYVKYIDKMFELSLEKMKGKFTPSGEPVTQAVFISNADQLSMRTLASMGAIDMLLQTTKRFEANQPETMRACYIVNANSVFASLFALLKPILSQRTFGKMHVFSSAMSSKCQDILHSNIPKDVLPVRLGGTKTDFVDIYANDDGSSREQGDEPEFLSVTVPAADRINLSFTIDIPQSTISWNFRTDKYDIAFAVSCGDKVYYENTRLNSHEKAQEGKIVCETEGNYLFTFDNTYSRLRSKELEYKINIERPDGAKQVFFE